MEERSHYNQFAVQNHLHSMCIFFVVRVFLLSEIKKYLTAQQMCITTYIGVQSSVETAHLTVRSICSAKRVPGRVCHGDVLE